MTTFVVMLDPPRAGLVLRGIADAAPLSASEAASLYRAMAADVLKTAERSRGDLLINFRDEATLPDGTAAADADAAVRELAAEALDDPDAARFEVQVGSTPAARAGNTATHLLEREEVDSVVFLDPRAPTVERTDLDGASMSLRRSETVIGAGTGGRVYYHGMSRPIDFDGAYDVPEVGSIVDRARAADHEIDFAPTHPVVTSPEDLATLQSLVEARLAAGAPVPEATVAVLADLDLQVGVEDGRRVLVQSG